ncbi:MAG TPA: S8 family serine peptidase [Salegentibacter sp.]|nr:S8 family serine peptidase [Salegentibacter sp.]
MKIQMFTGLPSALMLLLIFSLFISCSQESLEQGGEEIRDINEEKVKYIIVFHENAVDDIAKKFPFNYSKSQDAMVTETKEILKESKFKNVEILKVFSHTVKGAVLKLAPEQAEELKKYKEIKYIEKDRYELMAPPCGKGNQPPCGNEEDLTKQQIPYGITRVGGVENYTGQKVAWIIDSGIDIDHPDLNVGVSRGFRAPEVAPHNLEHPFDDDNGHGTHVAGIIAALNNDFGVIGVAPGATVIPIKVLGENGYGWWTDIIAGVDYVAAHANPGDVVNMSIGGVVTQAVDDAVFAASEKGIWFIISAGNNSNDANLYSPARVNGNYIVTVSAIDEFDNWANFSNYGNPPIDYAAPGVMVLSTYPNDMYVSLSGTSMASPHAAGVILLSGAPVTDGTFVNSDPDGSPDPIIVFTPEPCEQLTWYKDFDNDGYGVDSSATNITACEKPENGYALISGDCDDSDALVFPGAAEICKNCDTRNDSECEISDVINLTATGYKNKGVWHADLSWNYSGTVDIYRDGGKVITITSTAGNYTDVTGIKGSGSLTYQICETGSTANCSNEVTLQF